MLSPATWQALGTLPLIAVCRTVVCSVLQQDLETEVFRLNLSSDFISLMSFIEGLNLLGLHYLLCKIGITTLLTCVWMT